MLFTAKKTKIIISALLFATVTASAAVSVSASRLTKDANEGETEVTAKILGDNEPDPGSVSYVITIPDKIDFGALSQPENISNDNFKNVDFSVEATEINGFEGHDNWFVRVKVRDKGFILEEEERFFITQKTVTYPDSSLGNQSFEYGVYIGDNNISKNRKDKDGINIAFFSAAGQSASGQLRLNQNQLYGKELKSIAGEYSGTMIFHSSIVNTENKD